MYITQRIKTEEHRAEKCAQLLRDAEVYLLSVNCVVVSGNQAI